MISIKPMYKIIKNKEKWGGEEKWRKNI